jgi:hypothetical protein
MGSQQTNRNERTWQSSMDYKRPRIIFKPLIYKRARIIFKPLIYQNGHVIHMSDDIPYSQLTMHDKYHKDPKASIVDLLRRFGN